MLQDAHSSDRAQKALSARMRWRSATADYAQNSRMRPRGIELRAGGGDRLSARRAITHTLHPIAAMLQCRLRLLKKPHRDRKCDGSTCGEPRERDSSRVSRRL